MYLIHFLNLKKVIRDDVFELVVGLHAVQLIFNYLIHL